MTASVKSGGIPSNPARKDCSTRIQAASRFDGKAESSSGWEMRFVSRQHVRFCCSLLFVLVDKDFFTDVNDAVKFKAKPRVSEGRKAAGLRRKQRQPSCRNDGLRSAISSDSSPITHKYEENSMKGTLP